MPDYEPLWYWIRERERIRRLKDSGADWPWTEDPILGLYRFCCVRREDDRVTRWIRENIREPYAKHHNLWLMLCIARQINWPDTLASLIADGAWPVDDDYFKPQHITEVLNARKANGSKVYTGAYMISAPAEKGADKQAYIAETVIGDLWRRRDNFKLVMTFPASRTLQRVHDWITQSNGWGNFMAYQAVVDMRFTTLLEDAPDVRTWAAAGPGTLRGLNRLHGREVAAPLSQSQALQEMQQIYKLAWKATQVPIDFSDVPNCLCETDKYLRVKLGQGKPRALYVVGRGS